NQIGLSKASGNDLLLFRETQATALVQGATLTATNGTVSVSAVNDGDRGVQNNSENTVISIALDQTSATLDDATVNANGLSVTAQSAANYSMTGAKEINLVNGSTVADVIDGSHVTAGAGGVQITSSDTSTISAASSGEGGTGAAINYVSKDTNAYV